MIPIKNNLVNEQSGVLNEVKFGAKSENLGVIFQILRSQIYSDPVRAIVREYSTNSQDSHIAAGKPELPIQVTLPTTLESFLKIRDFGNGLTEQEVLEIYTSYGESTKRKDANQNGLLGIGSKSGFSYSDSFMVNSYKDGVMTVFNAYITPSDGSKMAMMGRGDTTEPNGIEIVIPIKGNDIEKFRQKAIEQVYPYFKVSPDITNITDEEKVTLNNLRNPVPLFSGPNWKFIGGESPSFIIMANVAYPISADTFNENEVREEVSHILKGGVIVEAKNGEVAFSASRESLQYDANTKKKLAAILNTVVDELVKQGTDKFNGCGTLWDAKCMWKEVFTYGGSLYHLRHLFGKSLTFNGHKLNDDNFSTSSVRNGSVSNVYYTKGGYKVVRDDVYKIVANNRNLVVINDTNIVNGIINRVVGPLYTHAYDGIYVLTFKGGTHTTPEKVMAAWMSDVGFDGKTVSLINLNKEAISKYYPNNKNSFRGFPNSKHSRKEFTFNINADDSNSSYSNYWESVDIDPSQDTGVYVELERFCPIDTYGRGIRCSNLKRQLKDLVAIGITPPSIIYGFKPSSVAEAKINPNMISLWRWIKDNTDDYLTKFPLIHQEFANHQYIQDLGSESQQILKVLLGHISRWKLIKIHPEWSAFIKKLDNVGKYDKDKLDIVERAIPEIKKSVTLKVVYDFTGDLEVFKVKYPLFFMLLSHLSSYHFEENKWEKSMSDYINLVDKANSAPTGICAESAATALTGEDSELDCQSVLCGFLFKDTNNSSSSK